MMTPAWENILDAVALVEANMRQDEAAVLAILHSVIPELTVEPGQIGECSHDHEELSGELSLIISLIVVASHLAREREGWLTGIRNTALAG